MLAGWSVGDKGTILATPIAATNAKLKPTTALLPTITIKNDYRAAAAWPLAAEKMSTKASPWSGSLLRHLFLLSCRPSDCASLRTCTSLRTCDDRAEPSGSDLETPRN